LSASKRACASARVENASTHSCQSFLITYNILFSLSITIIVYACDTLGHSVLFFFQKTQVSCSRCFHSTPTPAANVVGSFVCVQNVIHKSC
jgi:hypothetical protein